MNPTASRAPVDFKVTNDNALSLLAGFSRAARAAGWTDEQIKETTERAMLREYRLLQVTLAAYTAEYLTEG
ncbi:MULTISPECIES: hypothetical protein [Janthinobacterium]|uniref:Uncharacterized protein n=1 Tax=Janthinobacterium lividum TaxID=29581 RepID=A0AAJ4MPE8_9BURK|nr:MULTISPECIES: hypothetical protein [Janthinobacterium]KAB0325512.1 hypothetical protein F3B38_17865 [Janthinobacterium lividum]MCC7682769.1 hypothetical protein [Janthinobacterium sp. FW305-128]MDN2713671.1 hypothetical protein [Janthinobacterium sp. SUN120]QSX94613.1 hypothetical protein J3P46_18005 [Janthinobacterium lividum]UGQ34424.1 hypothetical protein LSO07_18125 [Janthinobacterium sp. PLB04]